MLQFSKIRDLKLFKKKFKHKSNISIKMDDEDFFGNFINEVKFRYKNIIDKKDDAVVSDYIKREICRLELEIEGIERSQYSSNFEALIYPSMITIVLFIFGIISSNYMQVNNPDIENMVKSTGVVISAAILVFITVVSGIIISEILTLYNRYSNNKKIRFNKICIIALKEIKNNTQNPNNVKTIKQDEEFKKYIIKIKEID